MSLSSGAPFEVTPFEVTLPADGEPTGSHPVEALDLLGSTTAAPVDNADPHPVAVSVSPRDVYPGPAGCSPFQWEAEYEFTVDHPATCSGHVEECPVADYFDVVGLDQNFQAAFPEPDFLSDEDLAALDGTVRFVTVTRTYTHSSGPYGDDWDVDYDFAWSN